MSTNLTWGFAETMIGTFMHTCDKVHEVHKDCPGSTFAVVIEEARIPFASSFQQRYMLPFQGSSEMANPCYPLFIHAEL